MKRDYKIKVYVDCNDHVVCLIPIKVPKEVLSASFIEHRDLPRHDAIIYYIIDKGPTNKVVGDEMIRSVRELLKDSTSNDLVSVEVYVDDVTARFPNRSEILKTKNIVENLKNKDWKVCDWLWSDFEYFTMPGKLLGNYKYETSEMIVSTEPPLLGERSVWMEKVMSILIEWWYDKEENNSIPNT